MPRIKPITLNALSNVDKATMAELAGAAARALSGSAKHKRLGIIADLVAKGLQQQPDAVGPAPISPGNDRLATSNRKQQALLLKLLETERPQRSEPDQPDQTILPDGRTSFKGMLGFPYDTANIGQFSFTLINGAQLQVGQLRVAGNVGGQFWIADTQPGSWYRLKDRGARLLPVWIRTVHGALEVQIDGGPAKATVLAATDSHSQG